MMKSRRFMSAPKLRRRHRIGLIEYFDSGAETGIKTIAAMHSQCPLWAKADICGAKRHVRFTPESGHSRQTGAHVR
jgi:hypothetical protein